MFCYAEPWQWHWPLIPSPSPSHTFTEPSGIFLSQLDHFFTPNLFLVVACVLEQ